MTAKSEKFAEPSVNDDVADEFCGPIEAFEKAIRIRTNTYKISNLQTYLSTRLVNCGVEFLFEVFYDVRSERAVMQVLIPLIKKPRLRLKSLSVCNNLNEEPAAHGRFSYLHKAPAFMWQFTLFVHGTPGVTVEQAKELIKQMLDEVLAFRRLIINEAFDLVNDTPDHEKQLLSMPARGHA